MTWLRGILWHEYGVKPKDIQWVVSAKDSSAKTAGKVSRQESMVPKGLSGTRGPEGKDESDLLESGNVDALFHALEPRAYVQGHPDVARLLHRFYLFYTSALSIYSAAFSERLHAGCEYVASGSLDRRVHMEAASSRGLAATSSTTGSNSRG